MKHVFGASYSYTFAYARDGVEEGAPGSVEFFVVCDFGNGRPDVLSIYL